jgi:hypothetical protein
LYAGGWTLFLSKIGGLRNELLLFSATDRKQLAAGVRKTIPAMTSIMALCVISAIALNTSADKRLINSFSQPKDFVPVAQLNLSKQAYPSETLTQFTLDEPTIVGVFIKMTGL